jgi:DNA-binding NtrC family response regulator
MGLEIPHILIIEDDEDVRKTLQLLLEDLPATITSLSSPARVHHLLKEQVFDLILLDMNFSTGINTGNEGFYWMHQILDKDPQAGIVLITAYGSVDLAIRAIKDGAFDIVMKPWDNNKLISTILAGLALNKSKRALTKNKSQQVEMARIANMDRQLIACVSSGMLELQDLIAKAAPTQANMLITGENGTGKQLVAEEVHYKSAYSTGPFMSVDLNTLAQTVFESELFGYKKGAFTDARADRMGRFEAASGGTLFLDEIGNLPLNLQAKLLTAIQNREITPLGSSLPVPLNFRLITASNIDLEEAVARGDFREDLYFRLKTIPLHVPPLRERTADIPLLATHFLQIQNNRYDRDLKFSKGAISMMHKYAWPGNVRELEHTIEKAVILADTSFITENLLQLQAQKEQRVNPQTLQEIEQEAIKAALEKHHGNIVQAALSLGITRQTIYNKMKKYGI